MSIKTTQLKKPNRTYPEYVDSGIEWIGKIPKGWGVKKIKEITKIQIGWTPSTGISEYFEGENIWATIADMGSKVIIDTKNKISDKAIKSARIKKVKKGSLLYSFKLSVGKVAFAGQDMYTNEAIAAFEPLEKVNVRFLYYPFASYLINNANENIYGAKLLNQQLIKNSFIALPPKQEQQKIVNYLDEKVGKIEKIVFKKRQQIELLKEKRAATIARAVTRGLDSDVDLEGSGVEWIGRIPKGWNSERLKYLVNRRTEKAFIQNGNLRYVGLENIESQTGRILDTDTTIDEESDGIKFKKGDVLFGKLRPYLAKVTEIDFDGVCTGELLVLKSRKEKINSRYLFHRLLSNDFINVINNSTFGTKMPRADWSFIGNLVVYYPPKPEQQKIADYLDEQNKKIDAIINKIEQSVQLLQEYKTSLISSAVRGRIKIG